MSQKKKMMDVGPPEASEFGAESAGPFEKRKRAQVSGSTSKFLVCKTGHPPSRNLSTRHVAA